MQISSQNRRKGFVPPYRRRLPAPGGVKLSSRTDYSGFSVQRRLFLQLFQDLDGFSSAGFPFLNPSFNFHIFYLISRAKVEPGVFLETLLALHRRESTRATLQVILPGLLCPSSLFVPLNRQRL